MNLLLSRLPQFLLIAMVFIAQEAVCQLKQDQFSLENLKKGMWVENEHNLIGIGSYKIIPLNQFPIIDRFDWDFFHVRHGHLTEMFYSRGGHSNDSISVEDGYWRYFDSAGNLRKLDFWISGMHPWSRTFSEDMQLTSYEYKDFENDSDYTLEYLNRNAFKKSFYLRDTFRNIYYPYQTLSISDAEPRLYANFLYRKSDTFNVKLAARNDIQIKSFSSQQNIRILIENKPQLFPIHLLKGDELDLKIIYNPTSSNLKDTEEINISTSDPANPNYKIFCNTKAAHIDSRNISGWQKISLSQKSDRYLIIRSTGTESDVTITNSSGFEKRYVFFFESSPLKIDLTEFETGKYEVHMGSCNYFGTADLEIRE